MYTGCFFMFFYPSMFCRRLDLLATLASCRWADFYPSMTMFALPFKSWVAVTANGTEVSGTFLYAASNPLSQPDLP